jgi:DNA-binding NarL/FixJ family response regulator
MSVTIVVADNHDIVRQGLRLLLEEQADFRVVAEAAGGSKRSSWSEPCAPMCWSLTS